MRKMAWIQPMLSAICRAVLYEDGQGVWVFLYDRPDDAPCVQDYWFETLEDAEEWCYDKLGIEGADWKTIPDPLRGQPPHLVASMNNPAPAESSFLDDFSLFQIEVRRCVEVMAEQAETIQDALGGLRVEEGYRRRAKESCAALVGTKFDVISELAGWDEVSDAEQHKRAQRIIRWLAEDIERMDKLVKGLQQASKAGAADTSAAVLVAEAATEVLKAFGRVKVVAGLLRAG